MQNSKPQLKQRAYLYALKIIKFIDILPKFFSYALKSANESKFWIGLLRDSGEAQKDKADILLKETIELANILGSSILTLKGKRNFKL